jgi:hypothetical protein
MKPYYEIVESIDKAMSEGEFVEARKALDLAKHQAQHQFVDATFAMRQLRHQEKRMKSLEG